MTIRLAQLPWHGRIGAFVALSLAGVAAFWNWYARPAGERTNERRVRLEAIHTDIIRGTAAAQRLPSVRRDVQHLEAQLQTASTLMPAENDAAELLRRIVGMAEESNLLVRSFTPRGVTTRRLHAEWPVEFELVGTYHNLGAFLERVGEYPRIISVDALHIRGMERGGTDATIAADCTATTFVLLGATEEPAGPAAPPRKGPGSDR